MKKLIVAAVAAIVFIANIQAQNKKWSLKECIDYAILHNIEAVSYTHLTLPTT